MSKATSIDQKIYKIPFEYFTFNENKENKDKMLDLLQNYNYLNKDQYSKFGLILEETVEQGDTDLVEIILSEEIFEEGMSFKINKKKSTASLYKIFYRKKEFTVPRTITHDSKTYTITSIIGDYTSPKMINILKFSEDSEIRTIYKYSFYDSPIENLYIPPKMREIKGGFSYRAKNLRKFTISPKNKIFMMKDDQFLLGKSDIKSDNFDILVFSNPDIQKVKIPSSIKIISPYSFQDRELLTEIEFEENSELQLIGEKAFQYSKIKKISIPPHVSKICDSAFDYCLSLEIINIPKNSQLLTICKYVFMQTKIEQLYIPSNLKELKNGWSCQADNLKRIEISPENKNFKLIDGKLLLGKSDPKSDNFDVINFAARDIQKVQIPSNVKIISQNAFYSCKNLIKIEFESNSELKSIEKWSFSYSGITEILIPKHVLTIGENAFNDCKNLEIVEFQDNSELKSIEIGLFVFSGIKKISIPSHISQIGQRAFSSCKNLEFVEIPNDSELKSIGYDAFYKSKIRQIFIPEHVSEIGEEAFRRCKNLEIVEFQENSELKSIEESLFAYSGIKKISIPNHVSKIGNSAFSNCENLEFVEISNDSELKSIGNKAFYETKIRQMFIPEHVSEIGKEAFRYCKNIEIVEISENSKLNLPIGFNSIFTSSPKMILMIPAKSRNKFKL